MAGSSDEVLPEVAGDHIESATNAGGSRLLKSIIDTHDLDEAYDPYALSAEVSAEPVLPANVW